MLKRLLVFVLFLTVGNSIADSEDSLWVVKCEYGPEYLRIQNDKLSWRRQGKITFSRHPTKEEYKILELELISLKSPGFNRHGLNLELKDNILKWWLDDWEEGF